MSTVNAPTALDALLSGKKKAVKSCQSCGASLKSAASAAAPPPPQKRNGFIHNGINLPIIKHELKKSTTTTTSDRLDPKNYDDVVRLAETLKRKTNLKETPKIGIICGSGLGDLADRVQHPKVISYADVPGFPKTSVLGHKGNVVFGWLSGSYVMCMQGRFHPYEHNMDLALCAMPVRIMHLLGVETLIVSNAAGGMNTGFHHGDLMIIKDHIFIPGLNGLSPLTGVNDPRFGARFVSVHDAYDRGIRSIARNVAADMGVNIHEGVYVMNGGPQYETPTEIRFLKAIGGDAVGMSTCHEVVVARQCRMRVFGFSLITNVCNTDVDTSVEVSHEEVLEAGRTASSRACRFVAEVVRALSNNNDEENDAAGVIPPTAELKKRSGDENQLV